MKLFHLAMSDRVSLCPRMVYIISADLGNAETLYISLHSFLTIKNILPRDEFLSVNRVFTSTLTIKIIVCALHVIWNDWVWFCDKSLNFILCLIFNSTRFWRLQNYGISFSLLLEVYSVLNSTNEVF